MCTAVRYLDADGHMYLGRNLDWAFGYGEVPRVWPAGARVPYQFMDDAPAAHAVIGMCIDYKGYPMFFDCGNDAGLAVAGLNFPGYAEFPAEPRAGATNVCAFEFPFWIAANFSSVDEVEAALANTVIVGKSAGEGLGVSYLHWIVGDSQRCIVIEQTADGMHVYDDPVGVLANQPTFAWHMENLRTYITANNAFPQAATWGIAELAPFGAGAGMRGIPGDCYSPSRFVKAAYLNANYPAKAGTKDNVARMFHTLGNVSMAEGAAAMADGKFEKTIYTGCFEAETVTYFFNTYDDPTIYYASISDALDAAGVVAAAGATGATGATGAVRSTDTAGAAAGATELITPKLKRFDPRTD